MDPACGILVAGADDADPAAYLEPGTYIDSDHDHVIGFANRAAGRGATALERAVRLFYAVRDGLRYDPYAVSLDPEAYRASAIARRKTAFCVPKAILLTAAARAVAIPARLGFADVRNHLTTPKLRRLMGTDVFAFHGFSELYLEGRWVKATPVFNLELCEHFGVAPLDFDGRSDALFHEFEADGRRHMEYLRDRGRFADFSFEAMMAAFREVYSGRIGGTDGERDPVFHRDS